MASSFLVDRMNAFDDAFFSGRRASSLLLLLEMNYTSLFSFAVGHGQTDLLLRPDSFSALVNKMV